MPNQPIGVTRPTPPTKNNPEEIRRVKDRVSGLHKLAQKNKEKILEESLKLFNAIMSGASNSSTIYNNYWTKTYAALRKLITKASDASSAQRYEMGKEKNFAPKIDSSLPTLEECIYRIDQISEELAEIKQKTDELSLYYKKLIGRSKMIVDKFLKYKAYWLNRVEKSYNDKIIKPLEEIENSTIDAAKVNETDRRLNEVQEGLLQKHENSEKKLEKMRVAFRLSNKKTRIDLLKNIRQKAGKPPIPKMSDMQINQIEQMPEKNGLVKVNEHLKLVQGTQVYVRRQLDDLLKHDTKNIPTPEFVKNHPVLSAKNKKNSTLIGEYIFYMMGIIVGMPQVLGILQKEMLVSMQGFNAELNKNKHRKLHHAKEVAKKIFRITLSATATLSELTGVGAGIVGILEQACELVNCALWLANGVITSASDLNWQAVVGYDDDIQQNIEETLATLYASDVPDIGDDSKKSLAGST